VNHRGVFNLLFSLFLNMISFMERKDRLGLRTWIEIDTNAISHNYKVFRSLVPVQTKIMGVVKSNAYGHNLVEFAKKLQSLDVDYLGVDSVVEGLALRREGVSIPILVLGYTLPEMILAACEADLDITVSHFDYFNEIEKLNLIRPLRVHIKVDTGMHRHGFQLSDMSLVLEKIKSNKKIKAVGLYTHFAAAKNPAFPKKTQDQISEFNIWRESFSQAGLEVLNHACATSGTILFPEAHFDMVRVGIGLYGIFPSIETSAFVADKFTLIPVLSWRTVVGEIKTVKAGERIGYDFTEKLERDSKVAILPVGYWHVFPRALSSIGSVLIHGKSAKVLGRVCMDIIMVDVTNIVDVTVGDVATIIGSDGENKITLSDMASLVEGSSDYETVTRINPLIKRLFV
jgi:alanine racemase